MLEVDSLRSAIIDGIKESSFQRKLMAEAIKQARELEKAEIDLFSQRPSERIHDAGWVRRTSFKCLVDTADFEKVVLDESLNPERFMPKPHTVIEFYENRYNR